MRKSMRETSILALFICGILLLMVAVPTTIALVTNESLVTFNGSYSGSNTVATGWEVINWTINLTSTVGILDNITAVGLGNSALTRYGGTDTDASASNWTVWYVAASAETLGVDYETDCTYSTDTFQWSATDSDGTTYGNGTKSDFVIYPCADSTDATSLTIVNTDVNTSTLTITDGEDSETVMFMARLPHNSTHTQCNYGCTNVNLCKPAEFFNTTPGWNFCNITVNRTAATNGTVLLDVNTGTSATAPSNLPAALAITGLGIVTMVVYVVKRKRSAGD